MRRCSAIRWLPPDSDTPLQCVLGSCSLRERTSAQRREVIACSPELQERGRTKFADVADALATELVRRGCELATATLLADVGVTIFRTGFNRWVDNPESDDLANRLREAGAELAAAVAAVSHG